MNSQLSDAPNQTVETWFLEHFIKSSDCSMTAQAGKELCPDYYQVLAAAADWHVVSIFFSVILIFAFLGLAMQSKD
jgi:hypothetical protein